MKSHNPFAVNDVWFARQTGFPSSARTRSAAASSTGTRKDRPERAHRRADRRARGRGEAASACSPAAPRATPVAPWCSASTADRSTQPVSGVITACYGPTDCDPGGFDDRKEDAVRPDARWRHGSVRPPSRWRWSVSRRRVLPPWSRSRRGLEGIDAAARRRGLLRRVTDVTTAKRSVVSRSTPR